ncbi:UDP-N-acetylmuramoyl-L-alanine--D-glutamate ligase [Eubacteriales bacterium KG127]
MSDMKFNVKNKKILVVGLGKSGIAASQILCRLGAKVSVQDNKLESDIDPQLLAFFSGFGVNLILGRKPYEEENYELIILSPGVDTNLPWIKAKQKNGCKVIGELELAYLIGSGRYVAITGTNGKTTTTTLVGEIFKLSGRKTHVVGNIGVAVIAKAESATENDWLVTETSSFQLETIENFKPEIAAILNLTPDHLNRHKTMEAYAAAKSRIFENQDESEVVILNGDDPLCVELSKSAVSKIAFFSRRKTEDMSCFVENNWINVRNFDGSMREILPVEDIKILGEHNLENVLAAVAICYFAGINSDVIREAVSKFKGVEHRIEPVSTVDGVEYFNDSKGTNIEATITAIKALEDNILLIAGGDGKGQDFKTLVKELCGKVKTLILLGRDAKIIAEEARKVGFSNICIEKDMKECVYRAVKEAQPGDKVLLSPACASWDMYDNYEQRGADFKSWVFTLEK